MFLDDLVTWIRARIETKPFVKIRRFVFVPTIPLSRSSGSGSGKVTLHFTLFDLQRPSPAVACSISSRANPVLRSIETWVRLPAASTRPPAPGLHCTRS